eukprot:TRINITY_DN6972_c0_g2_i4.p1 TRINITY_DN6972_c0_g2~~TRINITY_DN6972_c0_g2_i4.p1  ORF type:complete len:216 (+),score=38.17 TRINITY_DN6972_c0_g2_i4:710-1357(+)
MNKDVDQISWLWFTRTFPNLNSETMAEVKALLSQKWFYGFITAEAAQLKIEMAYAEAHRRDELRRDELESRPSNFFLVRFSTQTSEGEAAQDESMKLMYAQDPTLAQRMKFKLAAYYTVTFYDGRIGKTDPDFPTLPLIEHVRLFGIASPSELVNHINHRYPTSSAPGGLWGTPTNQSYFDTDTETSNFDPHLDKDVRYGKQDGRQWDEKDFQII